MLRNADGGWGGGVNFSRKKRYEGVRFKVISVTRGVQFPGKKHYVTLEWPLTIAALSIKPLHSFNVIIDGYLNDCKHVFNIII